MQTLLTYSLPETSSTALWEQRTSKCRQQTADAGLERLAQSVFISINNNTCLPALPFETLPDVTKQQNKPVNGSIPMGALIEINGTKNTENLSALMHVLHF